MACLPSEDRFLQYFGTIKLGSGTKQMVMMNAPPRADSLSGLAKTALLPLYLRAQETLRGDRILKDVAAVAMMKQLNLRLPSYAARPTSHLAYILGSRLFDYGVMYFLETSPNGIVINLGAGLCSRFQRLDNQQVRWYDIDFPEVNAIRAQFFQTSDRYQWISQSFLETSWIDRIQQTTDQSVLVLLEGVSMFLSASDLQFLFTKLRQSFESAQVLMDVVCLENLWHRSACQVLACSPTQPKWSLRDSLMLENWDIGIQVLEENYYLSYLKHFSARLQVWNRPWMIPSIPLLKNANRLLRLGLHG